MVKRKVRPQPKAKSTDNQRALMDWLERNLSKDGPRMVADHIVGLAAHWGKHPNTVRRLLGKDKSKPPRKFAVSDLPIIAEYFGDTVPALPGIAPVNKSAKVVTVPIDGYVEAGMFRDGDQLSQVERNFTTPRDSKYPNVKHMAYEVRGDSMNLAGILEGDTIIGVDFQETGRPLANGMKVVIEQNRDGLIERSLKVAMVYPDRVEFQPRSTNASHKPIVLMNKNKTSASKQIRVLAIVRRITRDEE